MVNRCIIKVIKEEKRKEINMSHKTCRWKYLRLVLDLITGWFCWFWYCLQAGSVGSGSDYRLSSVGSGTDHRLVLLVLDVFTGWFCWLLSAGTSGVDLTECTAETLRTVRVSVTTCAGVQPLRDTGEVTHLHEPPNQLTGAELQLQRLLTLSLPDLNSPVQEP